MIVCVGDAHGNSAALAKIVREHPAATVIQVGDFGLWPQLRRQYVIPERPVYFIAGNHEHHPSIRGITTVTEVWPNALYVPRGTVLELDGKRIGFCGGADSVDCAFRTPQVDWFPDEAVRDVDVDPARYGSVDLLVTHSPPQSAIAANFDPRQLAVFGLPPTWVSDSAVRIQRLWEALGHPPLICGHMHASVRHRGVTILRELEVVEIP